MEQNRMNYNTISLDKKHESVISFLANHSKPPQVDEALLQWFRNSRSLQE